MLKLTKAAIAESSSGTLVPVIMGGLAAATVGAAAQISTSESEIQSNQLMQDKELASRERMQSEQLASDERRHIRELEHAARMSEPSSPKDMSEPSSPK